ncbi:MAG: hypothetical protein HY726_10940 [Candidatus Rokubacteria bacterium]|nr:hypothetical protein [Candidatus Rokubacteria bacterium]
MLLIAEPPGQIPAETLAGKERDALVLTWEERRWGRRRAVTRGGREVALGLPTGSVMSPGSVLAVQRDWYLVVEPAQEPVLAAMPRNPADAIRLAFEVGNRHFSLAVERLSPLVLLVPDDPAMERLLSRSEVPWERRVAVFEPIGGGAHRHV